MTKEELIESALKETNFTDIKYYLIIVGIALTISVFFAILMYVVTFFLPPLANLNLKYNLILGAVLFISIILVGVTNKDETDYGSKGVSDSWKEENFYGKYLESQEKERVKVEDMILEDNGYRVSLDSDKSQRILFTDDFKFEESGDSYIEAIWVEGLGDYGIEDGYYNTKLYIGKGL